MDINHLKEFVVLAETLNFTKASEILFISQPSLTRHIQTIEEEVDTRLFFRTKQYVKLTNAGNEFLHEIKLLLKQYDQIMKRMNSLKESGSLKLGILYYIEEPVLFNISLFKERYPEINLDYFLGTPNDIIKVLLNDDIDMGNSMNVEFAGSNSLDFFASYRETLVIMINEQHHLKSYSSIPITDLKDEPFVFVDDNFYRGYLKLFSEACKKYGGFTPHNIKYVEDYEKMLLTVRTEPVAAVVTNNMEKQGCKNCVFIPIEQNILSIDRGFFYKKENFNPAIPLFLELFHRE